jgi:hypothetical protein
VADARNKLTEFARRPLPPLKARDRSTANQVERFIVELQRTLVTLTAHYRYAEERTQVDGERPAAWVSSQRLGERMLLRFSRDTVSW